MSSSEFSIVLESFTFHPESETYRVRYDRAETPASMAVVATLGEILETDPTEMEQLYYTVDAESLDGLLGDEAESDADVRATFTFEGHRISVTTEEVVAVRAADRGPERPLGESVAA